MNLAHYLRNRRRYEIALWTLFCLAQWLGNVLVARLEAHWAQADFSIWEPMVWEGSSLLVLMAMLPLMLHFDRRFPLRMSGFGRNLLAHAAFTLPYSFIHVTGMVAIRKLVYAAAGVHYGFADWPYHFLYEYLKDFRTYAGLLAIIYLYRFVLLRAQGEARLLDAPEGSERSAGGALSAEPSERLLIKMLGKEFLVNVDDVDWLEAAGNYVNLHVGARIYPLRGTMTGIEQRLDPHRFSRVHRSCIVNLDRIAEIEPLETGDARIRLQSGVVVPFSRRYRAGLREKLEFARP